MGLPRLALTRSREHPACVHTGLRGGVCGADGMATVQLRPSVSREAHDVELELGPLFPPLPRLSPPPPVLAGIPRDW